MKRIVLLAFTMSILGCGSNSSPVNDIIAGDTRKVNLPTLGATDNNVAIVDKIRSEGWDFVSASHGEYWFVRKQLPPQQAKAAETRHSAYSTARAPAPGAKKQ